MVSAIGRQQTVQSSISDCSRCDVSTSNGNDSPQCGQVISVSTVSSMGKSRQPILAVDQSGSSLSTIGFPILAETMDSTYGIFGSTEVPAFWPAYFSSRKQKALKPSGVAGKKAADQSKGCILVVEDHDDTLRSMKMLLNRLGYEVLLAENMTEALRIAEEQPFDILLSDIGLPDGNGLELLKQIRARRNVPALALSGFGMDEDIDRSREAGFADHLTKPVSIDRLQAAIAQLEADAD
jgi:CheY-like chemotaxis protein